MRFFELSRFDSDAAKRQKVFLGSFINLLIEPYSNQNKINPTQIDTFKYDNDDDLAAITATFC